MVTCSCMVFALARTRLVLFIGHVIANSDLLLVQIEIQTR